MKKLLIRLLTISCALLNSANGESAAIRLNYENLLIRESHLAPFGETMHRMPFSLGIKANGFLLFAPPPGGHRHLLVNSKEIINLYEIWCFVPTHFDTYYLDETAGWKMMAPAYIRQSFTTSFVLFSSENTRSGKSSGPYSGIMAIGLTDVFSLAPVSLLEALSNGNEVTIKIKISASQLILTTGEYKIVDVESAALICRLNESETTKSDSAPKISGASTETQGIMAEPMPSSPAN